MVGNGKMSLNEHDEELEQLRRRLREEDSEKTHLDSSVAEGMIRDEYVFSLINESTLNLSRKQLKGRLCPFPQASWTKATKLSS